MRLLEILFYLLKNNKSTTKELSKHFNVSMKTIQRDIDKLTILGIPIVTYRGGNGGIELDKDYTIHKGFMTIDDYKSLIMSLYISEKIFKNVNTSSIIEKMLMIDSKKVKYNLDKLKSCFVIDLENNDIDIFNEVCIRINQALDAGKAIEIIVDEKKYETLPISYILRKEGMFLYCYSDDYMLIKINKISQSKIIDKIINKDLIEYINNKNDIKMII